MKIIGFKSICSANVKRDLLSLFPKLKSEIETFGTPEAICDISGRDSIAATIKAFQEEDINCVLPIAVHIPTEYGSYETVEHNVGFLQKYVKKRFNGKIYNLIIVDDTEFWRILNGRYIGEIIQKFGFYSPCLGCHLYVHSIRTMIAKFIGCRYVISGAKESHNGRIKINQLPTALNAYSVIMNELGIEHLLPLRFIKEGTETEKILGIPWKEGENQLRCVFSKNYNSFEEKSLICEAEVYSYFNEYAIPLARKLLEIRRNTRDSNNKILLDSEIDKFIQNLLRGDKHER